MTKKILVAEDARATRQVVSFLLANRGFEVIEATDGNEALRKVRSERPDLLILDSDMPEKSGYQVYQALKMDQECCRMPVLFMVTKDDVVDLTKSVPPAECLVAKPFTAHDLLQRVQKALG
jgi:CheY-like chemotaxis protein